MSNPPCPPRDRPPMDAYEADSIAPRQHPRQFREYHWGRREAKPWVWRLTIAVVAVVFVFSAGQIIRYAAELHASREASAELRALYYGADDAATAVPADAGTEQPSATEAAVPTGTPSPTKEPEPTPAPTLQAALLASVPSPTARTRLPAVPYPGNPYRITQSRFIRLQRQNSDIIGWLSIEGLLDEAVVHRDNEYYLRRDYRGYHNDNGAVFLEETCDLTTRPYTLMLYAHNMKSGAMFGCLRNYENESFYENNPFVTFDTAYEDGRYVIFAISTIRTDSSRWGFVNFARLTSDRIEWRETEIAMLRRLSMYMNGVEVTADDQLLLLITCTGDDIERRVVAARRLRPGETEEQLLRLVQHTRKQ